MILIAFHISHTLNTKRHTGSEKHIQILDKILTFRMHQLGIKNYLMTAN